MLRPTARTRPTLNLLLLLSPPSSSRGLIENKHSTDVESSPPPPAPAPPPPPPPPPPVPRVCMSMGELLATSIRKTLTLLLLLLSVSVQTFPLKVSRTPTSVECVFTITLLPIHSQGKPKSDLSRVLVLNDPPARSRATLRARTPSRLPGRVAKYRPSRRHLASSSSPLLLLSSSPPLLLSSPPSLLLFSPPLPSASPPPPPPLLSSYLSSYPPLLSASSPPPFPSSPLLFSSCLALFLEILFVAVNGILDAASTICPAVLSGSTRFSCTA